MRLIELDNRWYVLTDPVPRMQRPESKKDGVQCMCSSVVREASAEEVQRWKEQRCAT